MTLAAVTVTVHDSPPVNPTSGLSVNDAGPPETVAECVPLTVHWIEYHAPATFTGSLNPRLMLAQTGAAGLPAAGNVLITFGEESWAARGFGAAIVKSAKLLLVSIAPPPFRRAAVVLDRTPVGDVSEQLALPYPTKSSMAERTSGTHPDSCVVVLRSATLPEPAAIAIVPVASGSGSGIVMMVVPAAS